jgi:hypothetical protein
VHIVVVRTDRYDGDEGPARGTVVEVVPTAVDLRWRS